MSHHPDPREYLKLLLDAYGYEEASDIWQHNVAIEPGPSGDRFVVLADALMPDRAADASIDPSFTDCYVLVHPWRFPSHCAQWIRGGNDLIPDTVTGDDFDRACAEHVSRVAASCARRVILLDEHRREDLDVDGEFMSGVPLDGWEVRNLDLPFSNEQARGLVAGIEGNVLVGGFAREDCVSRIANALRSADADRVRLDDPGVLPLTVTAYLALGIRPGQAA